MKQRANDTQEKLIANSDHATSNREFHLLMVAQQLWRKPASLGRFEGGTLVKGAPDPVGQFQDLLQRPVRI